MPGFRAAQPRRRRGRGRGGAGADGAYLKGGVFAPRDEERALGLFRAAAAQGGAAATAIVARWPADDVTIVLDLL